MTKRIFSLTTLWIMATNFLSSPVLAATGLASEDELSLYFSKEEMVEVTARAPRPLSQVAENVTIVTAEEIRRMNARSVSEILNRVPGVFVQFHGRDFNSINDFFIQDSSFHHVLVLVDGVRWNFDLEGMAVTNSIPVETIKRIEVIKGPASSTWGSALGGVVNIITRDTGASTRPHGSLYASHGESNSQHYSATLKGKAGPAGYFLSAASQSSDGINLNRAYDEESIYGKIDLTLPRETTLTLTAGYSNPYTAYGDLLIPYLAWYGKGQQQRNFWTTISLDSALDDSSAIHISGFRKKQKFMYPPLASFSKATTTGGNIRLDIALPGHLVTMGAEIGRVEGDSSNAANVGFEETWGLYFNDTVSLGTFSLIPGVRYDHLSLTDNQVSPSLGVTWRFSEITIFRAQVARGFRKPYLDDRAPALKPETAVSYQAGLETATLPGCTLKIDLFRHDVKDTWGYDANWNLQNGGEVERYGYELELITLPWHRLSLEGSFTYVYTDYHNSRDNDDIYNAKLTLLYDDPEFFTAQLFGQYLLWNEEKSDDTYHDDTLIWDLNLYRNIALSEKTSLDLFATIHNLFSGSHNWIALYPNAPRWLEAGLRFHF